MSNETSAKREMTFEEYAGKYMTEVRQVFAEENPECDPPKINCILRTGVHTIRKPEERINNLLNYQVTVKSGKQRLNFSEEDAILEKLGSMQNHLTPCSECCDVAKEASECIKKLIMLVQVLNKEV